jgi:hypothetical protein
MMDAIGWMTRFGRRMLMELRRRIFDADLEEEMRLHQELRELEQVERGVSPEEAHSAAERRFGNKLVLREESRDMWGWNSACEDSENCGTNNTLSISGLQTPQLCDRESVGKIKIPTR